MKYKKQVVVLIIISTILRLLAAAGIELSNDEVYYWTYAQHLQWNYFDHPPVIAVMIRLFTGNLFFQQEIFLRSGSIVCAAINTWLIYLLGARMKDEFTGWIAACLLTASIYAGILAGLMLLPDAPQMVFWTWGLVLIADICRPQTDNPKRNGKLLLFGLVAGICTMSKVHGIFLWVGVGLYILLYDRSKLRNPYIYIAAAISIIIVLPILWWNMSNHFVTWNYHENRVGFFSGSIQWDSFLRQVLGEFVYNNPVNVVLIIMALISSRTKMLAAARSHQLVILLIAIPLIITVWLMSLFKDTLPHWTGPAYTTLIPLAAIYVRNKIMQEDRSSRMFAWIKTAICLPLLLIATLIFSIHYLPYQLGSKDDRELGSGDLLLDCSGWKQFANNFNTVYRQDLARGVMKQNSTLMSDYWFPAAHLDYYVARKEGMNFLAAGALNNIHHYAWLNHYRLPLKQGDDVYFVVISNYYREFPQELAGLFEKVDQPVTINQYRGKTPVRHFYVYRLKGYKGGIPVNGVLY